MEIKEENTCKFFLQHRSDISGLTLKTVDLNNLLMSEHMKKENGRKHLTFFMCSRNLTTNRWPY